jgi:S-DNA-T family DNA segregation ATPase FtsK/SpoIIIE
VEFYLIDFKKGVEFKCYAEKRLPHARVVAIESDREFALSVLQRVDEELRRRGDMFRKLGVQDVAGYKRAGGTEPMPRRC